MVTKRVDVDRRVKHGLSRSSEYRSWRSMKQRCTLPSAKGYENYGGRGIQVCDEWLNDFAAFYRHIGPKPGPGYSVERINNNGHYEPGNVRWATAFEQIHNQRPRRARAFCRHGHEMTPENTYVAPKSGARACRECKRESVRRHEQTRPPRSHKARKAS